jgi:hypothetical protein
MGIGMCGMAAFMDWLLGWDTLLEYLNLIFLVTMASFLFRTGSLDTTSARESIYYS